MLKTSKATGGDPPQRSASASESSCAVKLDALTDDIGFLIRRAQVWIFQDFNRVLAPCRLRPAQYAVITVIADNPGLSQMAVAKSLGIERAHLMHILDALEERNLIERAPSPRDRRSHQLTLTAPGKALLRQASKLITEHQRNVAEKLGAEAANKLRRALDVFR